MTDTIITTHVYRKAVISTKDGVNGYFWRCSCGDQSQTPAKTEAAAKQRWAGGLRQYSPRHRKYTKRLRSQ